VSMNPDSLLIDVDDQEPVERWLQEQVAKGTPKGDIVKGVTDLTRWKKAMSVPTAYRKLSDYVPQS
jgi:hypothetical protein